MHAAHPSCLTGARACRCRCTRRDEWLMLLGRVGPMLLARCANALRALYLDEQAPGWGGWGVSHCTCDGLCARAWPLRLHALRLRLSPVRLPLPVRLCVTPCRCGGWLVAGVWLGPALLPGHQPRMGGGQGGVVAAAAAAPATAALAAAGRQARAFDLFPPNTDTQAHTPPTSWPPPPCPSPLPPPHTASSLPHPSAGKPSHPGRCCQPNPHMTAQWLSRPRPLIPPTHSYPIQTLPPASLSRTGVPVGAAARLPAALPAAAVGRGHLPGHGNHKGKDGRPTCQRGNHGRAGGWGGWKGGWGGGAQPRRNACMCVL